jgi:NAD-dependent SIR2 family protein deacetylase
MSTEFVIYVINKTIGSGTLSTLTPDEIDVLITSHRDKISKNWKKSKIQSLYRSFKAREETLSKSAAVFWVDDTSKPVYPPIHRSTEALVINRLLRGADRVLILAGAGMSAGLNIPTFRDEKGKTLMGPGSNITGVDLIKAFDDGIPNSGYKSLLNWLGSGKDYRVITTNIDGYFSRSGFDPDKVTEVHGSVYKYQCDKGPQCCKETWVDCSAVCPVCNGPGRTNVLTHGDRRWVNINKQKDVLDNTWESSGPMLVLEIGVGIHIPVLKDYADLMWDKGHELIRVNPTDWGMPKEMLGGPVRRCARADLTSADFFRIYT